jgi:hypothetical protein
VTELRENEMGVWKITAAGRKRSLIIPREHGAWGILLVPLVTGASSGLLTGGRFAGLVPLCVVALTLFWLRTPVESWAGIAAVRARTPGEFQVVLKTVLGLAIASGCGLIWLFWGGRNHALIWIGCAAAVAFLIQSLSRRAWRGSRTAAQMVGAAGLTATAPAAYYVVTGRLDAAAWSLWAANLLFAVNQIQFVQMRIHAAHVTNRRQKLTMGRGFLAGQFVLTALIVASCSGGIFRWPAATAFLPVLARGFAWFMVEAKPLAIHALGKSELAYACVFGLMMVVGMHRP